MRLLLLGSDVGLDFHSDALAQHHNRVSLHDRDPAESLAILEGSDDKRLERLKDELGHLLGLDKRSVRELLSSGALSDLPLDLGHLHSRVSSAHKSDRRVSNLELTRMGEDLHLTRKVLGSSQRVVALEDHNISHARHVSLDESLDVESDVESADPGVKLYVSANGKLQAATNGDAVATLTRAAGVYPSGVPGTDVNGDQALAGENSNQYIEYQLLV